MKVLSSKSITNISSVGIIYRKKDPSELFLEFKDERHPIKSFRGKLCFIGGNWIGEASKKDRCTLDTFRREVKEELTLKNPKADTLELKLLSLPYLKNHYRVKKNKSPITPEDRRSLSQIQSYVIRNAKPWMDFISKTPRSVLNTPPSPKIKNDLITLTSYWLVPVEENIWNKIDRLQRKFGNLSGESITLIISADEIIRHKFQTLFGHDHVLKKFLSKMKVLRSNKIITNKKTSSKPIGRPQKSYKKYLANFTILKTPA